MTGKLSPGGPRTTCPLRTSPPPLLVHIPLIHLQIHPILPSTSALDRILRPQRLLPLPNQILQLLAHRAHRLVRGAVLLRLPFDEAFGFGGDVGLLLLLMIVVSAAWA